MDEESKVRYQKSSQEIRELQNTVNNLATGLSDTNTAVVKAAEDYKNYAGAVKASKMKENDAPSVQLIERSIIAARSEEDLRKKRANYIVIFNMEEKGDAEDRAMTDLVIQTCMKEKLSMDRIKVTRFARANS